DLAVTALKLDEPPGCAGEPLGDHFRWCGKRGICEGERREQGAQIPPGCREVHRPFSGNQRAKSVCSDRGRTAKCRLSLILSAGRYSALQCCAALCAGPPDPARLSTMKHRATIECGFRGTDHENSGGCCAIYRVVRFKYGRQRAYAQPPGSGK